MKDPLEGYIRLPIKVGVTDKCWRISEKTETSISLSSCFLREAVAWNGSAVISVGKEIEKNIVDLVLSFFLFFV